MDNNRVWTLGRLSKARYGKETSNATLSGKGGQLHPRRLEPGNHEAWTAIRFPILIESRVRVVRVRRRLLHRERRHGDTARDLVLETR